MNESRKYKSKYEKLGGSVVDKDKKSNNATDKSFKDAPVKQLG